MSATYTSYDAWEAVKYFFPDELPAFKKLVVSLPPDPLVVNIGAGAGVSGLAILETREDVYLHTVDIQDESSPYGCLAGERQVMEHAGFSHLLGERWFQHHADSKELAKIWNFPCDLVYVDGNHTYEGASGDILLWMPHIKLGGYMAVHDYDKTNAFHWPGVEDVKAYKGVDRAVNELLYPKWDFVWRVDSLIVFRKFVGKNVQAYHCHQ